MKAPWLIHPCKLDKEKGDLCYHNMCSPEYEEYGLQNKSMYRLMITGFCQGITTVNITDKKITIYMIAAEGFYFDGYQEYLQMLSESRLPLKEASGFDDAIRESIGIQSLFPTCLPDTDVWFDFENDILWTLTKDNIKHLYLILEELKKVWPKRDT
ncbi:MAG: hypothetical protein KAS02_02080 [Candidatus Pacebacteria bacterium]|nr:hypothetical protein [Candidatus Paceibacterota bacterium]